MSLDVIISDLLTILATAVTAYVGIQKTTAKQEESISTIKDDINNLNQKIERLYEIDKRLTILEERLANK